MSHIQVVSGVKRIDALRNAVSQTQGWTLTEGGEGEVRHQYGQVSTNVIATLTTPCNHKVAVKEDGALEYDPYCWTQESRRTFPELLKRYQLISASISAKEAFGAISMTQPTVLENGEVEMTIFLET